MKNSKKRLICFICIAIMLVSAFAVLAVAGETVDADVYGSNMFVSTSGSASVSASISGGLKITFGESSSSSDVSYSHIVDMKKFELTFLFADNNTNFEDMVFRFTDTDNSTKWVEVYLRKGATTGSLLQYRLKDNYSTQLESLKEAKDGDNQIATSALTSDLTLGFSNGAFYLITGKLEGKDMTRVNLDASNIQTLSFYKSISNLKIGLRGVESDEDDDEDEFKDSVLLLKRWENSQVVQELDKNHGSYSETLPVIIREKTGEGNVAVDITSETTVPGLKGAYEYDYIFPYYCIDIIGKGWQVKTKEPLAEEEEATEWKDISAVAGKLKHTLSLKSGDLNDQKYEFQIFRSSDDKNPTLTLEVESVEDKGKPKLKIESDHEGMGLRELVETTLTSNVIEAPKLNNTFEMPRITNASGILVDDPDGLDTYDNVKIEIGYKKPDSSENFTYTGYDVQLNAVGTWYFTYRVTDQAGNKFEFRDSDHKYVFWRVVDDYEPPVIDASELIKASYIKTAYTVPVPSISDNASGVDSGKTEFEVYKLDKDGNKAGLVELDENDRFKFEDVTPETWEASYVVVFSATDNYGNTSTAEMKIKVTAAADTTPDPLPFNETMEVILIVIASVAGVGLIILIFINPSDWKFGKSGKPKKDKVKRAETDYDEDDDDFVERSVKTEAVKPAEKSAPEVQDAKPAEEQIVADAVEEAENPSESE